MNDLEKAIQFEFKSADLLNEFVKLGTRAGPRRCYPVYRAVISKVENSCATDRIRVFFLDVE
jgi:hypothetical protein